MENGNKHMNPAQRDSSFVKTHTQPSTNSGRNRPNKRAKPELLDAVKSTLTATSFEPHRRRSQQPAPSGHPVASKSHTVTKRPTAKLSQRPNDIYVSNKSDFRAQLRHCNTLLNTSEFHEIFLHSIGNAITRAINLALTLVTDSHGGLAYEANTSTIELTDNLHPLHDDGDFAVNRRLNGCLHIRVFRHCREVLIPTEVADEEGAVGFQK